MSNILCNNFSIVDFIKLISKLIPISPQFQVQSNLTTVTTLLNLDTYFWINRNTRSIIFTFTLYFPDENNWMSCLIV